MTIFSGVSDAVDSYRLNGLELTIDNHRIIVLYAVKQVKTSFPFKQRPEQFLKPSINHWKEFLCHRAV